MNKSYSWIQLLLVILYLAVLSGCSKAAQDTVASEATEIPTETPIPPSPFPEPVEITFEATFNGNECTFSGPAEVPTGYTKIAFDNMGDRNFGPWVDHFLDGKTYQDFLNEVYLGPEESHSNPEWVEYPFYFTKDNKIWTFNLEEPGDYAIFVGSYTPWREYPCGSFQVVDAPPE